MYRDGRLSVPCCWEAWLTVGRLTAKQCCMINGLSATKVASEGTVVYQEYTDPPPPRCVVLSPWPQTTLMHRPHPVITDTELSLRTQVKAKSLWMDIPSLPLPYQRDPCVR